MEQGKIKFLVISMPPRHGKSELVSVRFPAWFLGRHPDRDVIHVSYASELTNDFSRRVRMIVRDEPAYRKLFPQIQLDPERARVNDWRTTAGGGFRSVGTGGGISGHGADLLIIDDPHKESEITPIALQQVYDWFTSGARTRLMPGGAIVLCMTRWDKFDLVGQVLRAANDNPLADQWMILNLPALAGDDDPLGRLPGEALWPEWYPTESLNAIRSLSESHFLALFQQDPQAFSQQLFDEKDFILRKVIRVGGDLRAAWCFDLALGEDDTSDYTTWARVTYNRDSGLMGFSHLHRERQTWPDAKKDILDLHKLYPEDDFVFPKHAFENMAVQALRAETSNMRIGRVSFPANSDKRSRAQVFADRVKAQKVFIQDGDLAGVWIREHRDFPSDHDDCLDVSTVGCHWFGLQNEFDAAIVDADLAARRRADRVAQERETLERLGHAIPLV